MSRFDFGAFTQNMEATAQRRRMDEAARRGVTVDELDAVLAAEAERTERKRREQQAEARARAARARREDIIDRYAPRVPARVRQMFIDDKLEDYPALIATRAWLGQDESFLLLCGGTGAGKTIAALWALTRLRGMLVLSPSLGAVIEPWSSDLERGVKHMEPSEYPLVVLDDLGIERISDERWCVGFDELIDARVGLRDAVPLRTIITTNLTAKDIKARYSERARSRIRASSTLISLPTKDMRTEKSS